MSKPTSVSTTTTASGKIIEQETTVTQPPSSSVEITTDSKGQAKLAVKVYAESPDDALLVALRLYKAGIEQLSVIKGE